MSFFVEDFDTQKPGALLRWARDDMDSGDPWGWCMSWLFDIAACIDLRGLEVPAELHYRAGAMGSHIEDESREQGLAYFPDAELIRAARVLNRYDDRCRAAGLDY